MQLLAIVRMANKLVVRGRPFVVYWNNIPSPYMVERFNALADRGSFDFEAWFNDRTEPDRSWDVDEKAWRFRYRYVPATRLFGRNFHWPVLLFGRRPDVLVSLYAQPAFVVGWAMAKLRRVKTAFRVLMTYDRWVSRHPIKDGIKRFLFRHVDAVETPGEDGKRFAMRYGVPAERIFLATHTVDIGRLQLAAERARLRRETLRNKLGLTGPTFIYVGRLWWGKGVNYLIDAFDAVQRQSEEPVSLLLVGDGADETNLKQLCADRGIRNVIFAGFQQKSELPGFYAVSDIFIFPTLGDPYGLVVDEAMACSLPVISTSAAGEINARIQEGVNGYIVPPEDSVALARRMQSLARDSALCTSMGRVSAQKVKGHTPENWAHDFERMVLSMLRLGQEGS
jgi:glycosyltransferase involved in cell wall biosynthesis